MSCHNHRRNIRKIEKELQKSDNLHARSDMLHERALNQAAKGHLFNAVRLESKAVRKDRMADVHERRAEHVAASDYMHHPRHRHHRPDCIREEAAHVRELHAQAQVAHAQADLARAQAAAAPQASVPYPPGPPSYPHQPVYPNGSYPIGNQYPPPY